MYFGQAKQMLCRLERIQVPEEQSIIESMPNRHWSIIADECNNLEVSHLYPKKDKMAEGSCKLV